MLTTFLATLVIYGSRLSFGESAFATAIATLFADMAIAYATVFLAAWSHLAAISALAPSRSPQLSADRLRVYVLCAMVFEIAVMMWAIGASAATAGGAPLELRTLALLIVQTAVLTLVGVRVATLFPALVDTGVLSVTHAWRRRGAGRLALRVGATITLLIATLIAVFSLTQTIAQPVLRAAAEAMALGVANAAMTVIASVFVSETYLRADGAFRRAPHRDV